MELLERLIEIFTSKERHASTKLVLLLAIIIAALVANNITGFTYYYNLEKRVNHIKSIHSLYRDSTISFSTRRRLLALENEVANRRNMAEYLTYLASEASNSSPILKVKNKPIDTVKLIPQKKPIVIITPVVYPTPRSGFWHLITSSGIYIIVGLIITPAIFFTSTDSTLTNTLAGLILLLVVVMGFSWINYFLFGLIPKLGSSWNWNYLTNVFLQFFLIYIYYKGITNTKKNKY